MFLHRVIFRMQYSDDCSDLSYNNDIDLKEVHACSFSYSDKNRGTLKLIQIRFD